MTKPFFLVFATAAIIVAGCAKGERLAEPAGRVVTISASLQSDAEGKASVSNDGVFTWRTGDQIGVWTSNDGGSTGKFTCFSLKDGESGKATAVFTGTLDDGYDIVAGPAVYPYRAGHSYDPGTNELTFNQPAAMDYYEGETKSHMAAMYSGTGTISFKHLSGLIRFTVFNVPAATGVNGYLRLRTTDRKTYGDFTVDMGAATPQIDAPVASSNQDFNIKFTSAPEDVVGGVYVVSFPVPVGTYGYLRLSNQKSAGDMIGYKEKTSSTTIARGQMINMPEVTLKCQDLADNESGSVMDNFCKLDYNSGYTGNLTTDAELAVVSNPTRTVMNASSKVLSVTSTPSGTYSGIIDILTKAAFTSDPVAYYPSGYRDNAKAFVVKMLYADPADATKYYPRGTRKSGDTSPRLPDRINGVAYDQTESEWARLIKADDWNYLQWDGDFSGAYRIDITPFLNLDGTNATSASDRVMYFDDFRLLKK